MFKAFIKNNTNSSVVDSALAKDTRDSIEIESIDVEEESFVHIDDDTDPSLFLSINPRYETIGIDVDKSSTQFCATVTARNLPEDDDSTRAPVDIVVALDVSGSMHGSKLDLCKTTLSLLLRELSSSDRFGLVTFGTNVILEIPVRKLTSVHRDDALAKIKRLNTHGCTNMSGGIGMAAKEIRSIEFPHSVQTIFLLTDGHANEGISDREGIVKVTKGCLGVNQNGFSNIPVHCFGYGNDHDHEMLRDIAGATEGGTYYYVDSDSNVSSAFGDALGGVLSVVAQNVSVSLKVPQASSDVGVIISKVYHDQATKNSDGSFTVPLNDFYAEESRDIVFDVSISNKTNTSPVVHVISSMLYLDTIQAKLVQSNFVKGKINRPMGNELSIENQHVALQCIRIKTTKVIEHSQKLAEDGKLDEAKTIITVYIEQLHNDFDSVGTSQTFITQMIDELNLILKGFESRNSYENWGGKVLQSRLMCQKSQRCCESSDLPNMYRSSKKEKIAKRMTMGLPNI